MVIPNQPIGQPIEHPNASAVLFLGAASVLCCGVLGPVAWALGRKALNDIEGSLDAAAKTGGNTQPYGGRAQVLVGYILGIVGTVLMIIFALLYLFIVLGGNA
ncbi:DUF4190 domain-containing protein [Nocardia sp. NBC_00508]|uniref:DUF4190 domain-containing protein n=1 Tax=Nocardia sp. NBC_00508 TaxID=2975992 RepID=UPI002E80C18C|nr:DUF4190 domain-containing protein [Nocardia sp. NBC_00508]WUD63693.1 DUF4190 domain-containing protein [Nocardia sp. NBC_00508]